MIIEYRDDVKCKEIIGKYVKIYRYYRKRDTNIIYELYDNILPYIDEPFDKLYMYILDFYKNKKSKSSCEVYRDTELGTIEITNKGVFPNILIVKI